MRKFIKTRLCAGVLCVVCGTLFGGCSNVSTGASNTNLLNEALQMPSLDISKSYAISDTAISTNMKDIQQQLQDDKVTENTENIKPQLQNDEIAELVNEYYAIKAERESYKLDKDLLKHQKRDGTISGENYYSQREKLEETIDDLHLTSEQLWQELITSGWKPENVSDSVDVTNLSDQELRDRFYTLRQQHDKIDEQQDIMEFQYHSGQLNRTEFISQYAELEYENDQTYWEMEPMIDELNDRNAWSRWSHGHDEHDRSYYDRHRHH